MGSKTIPLLAALALVVGSAAFADTPTVPLAEKLRGVRAKPGMDEFTLDKGVTEYGFLANFRLKDPTSQDITLRWAPFMSRNVQWGVDFSHHDNGSSSGEVSGLVNYYPGHGTQKTYPYVGAVLGTTFGDVGDCLVWGFQGGVKHFVAPNVALTGELQFRRMGDMDWSGAVAGLSYFGGTSPVGQHTRLPGRGSREIDINANLNFDDPVSEFFEFFYGPFMDDHLQWGVEASIFHSSGFTDGFLGGVVNYHFRGNENNRALPYVGAKIGTTWGDGPDTICYGAQAGIKYMLVPNVAFIPEFQWRTFSRSGLEDEANLRFKLGFFF